MADLHETAERLSRRRTRMLLVLGLYFILWQVAFYARGAADAAPLRAVDQVKVSAWIVWSGVLLLVLATGGGWFRKGALRRLLNDEASVSHRRQAQQAGFWAAMAACFLIYMVNLFEPVSTRDVVHAVLSLGVGVAILRYALLERRAERG